MKIIFNGKQLLELTETQKKVIKNDIPSEEFDNDMTRRCKYWLEHPCDQNAEKKQEDHRKKLKEKGKNSVPTNLLKLAVMNAEEHPTKHGYSDIKVKNCKVGNQSFDFSEDHQKVWRKMHEKEQEKLSKEEYLLQEEQGLEARMAWILPDKYQNCMRRLKLEWLPKLEERGILEIPSSDEELAELIFSQPDYKDRSQRDLEEKLREEALRAIS